MVAVTVLVAVLITDTVPWLVGDVDVRVPGGDRYATRAAPTVTVAVTVLVAVLITDTVPELLLVT